MFDPEEFGRQASVCPASVRCGEGIGEGKEPERDEPAEIDAGA